MVNWKRNPAREKRRRKRSSNQACCHCDRVYKAFIAMKSVIIEDRHRLLPSPNPKGRLPHQRLTKLTSSSKTQGDACKVSNLAMATSGAEKSGLDYGFPLGGGFDDSRPSKLKATRPPEIAGLSPRRAARAAMLKARFGSTILKAEQKLSETKRFASKRQAVEEPIPAPKDPKRRIVKKSKPAAASSDAKRYTREEPRQVTRDVKRHTKEEMIQTGKNTMKHTVEESNRARSDAKRLTIQEQRRAAREALEKVKQTVNFNETVDATRYFEGIIGVMNE